ncbi:MAG: hypothetical protein ACP5HS_10900 [Anaerolineae bacterium]
MTEQNTTSRGQQFGQRLWKAFKNFAIIFSFITNFILVLILVLLLSHAGTLFQVKSQVAEPLLLDLDQAVVALGQTTIASTVQVTDTVPLAFTLPLEQDTDAVLSKPVPLSVPAMFVLPGGAGSLNGTVTFQLPEGQTLPVALSMSLPVSTTIPVEIEAPVEIQLAEAGLAPAIEQLRAVLRPVTVLIQGLPDTAQELLHVDD